ncbi:MAG: 4Fe-4S dicluster domain-containing protein [Chloroflexi bacterium]|nr:4Fe-4S dicluster domain-containing protein [Chloroflexota bacterium]
MSERQHQPLDPAIEASLPHVNVDDLIVCLKYYVDETQAHIGIKDQHICAECDPKPCLAFCPAHVFEVDRHGHIMVSYQACIECGSCRIACPFHNVEWQLPRGGYGVAYKYG